MVLTEPSAWRIIAANFCSFHEQTGEGLRVLFFFPVPTILIGVLVVPMFLDTKR